MSRDDARRYNRRLPSVPDATGFRRNLLRWYRQHKRDLPWRTSADPYRVWVSEIMLQQTRVAAVIPYYERFLARFPTVDALAAAPEADLLAAWAGLGYYSRARNLQAAARKIVELGGFPTGYGAIRELPGIGDYTAAAVASIAFGLPHAAVDGNVVRVLSRIAVERSEANSTVARKRFQVLADSLLDPKQPGDFNQAMMELGATVCLPKDPQCLLCPVARFCEARAAGRQAEFPVKQGKAQPESVERRLLLIARAGELLLWQRPPESPRLAGFWELPEREQLPEARVERAVGEFRHTIVNTNYRCAVSAASIQQDAAGFTWVREDRLHEIPLSTTAKKALACWRS
jgi:A/G-specific adenine glycosylase